MEYTIFKICDGNIELASGDIKILLTNESNSITLDDDTYWSLMEDKQHLIKNGLIFVSQKTIESKEVEKANKRSK